MQPLALLRRVNYCLCSSPTAFNHILLYDKCYKITLMIIKATSPLYFINRLPWRSCTIKLKQAGPARVHMDNENGSATGVHTPPDGQMVHHHHCLRRTLLYLQNQLHG